MTIRYAHLKHEVGIVIHLVNDRLHLEQQLPALLRLESLVPIVFVLDGTQDDCPQKIKEFRAEYGGDVWVIENAPAQGRSACWNQGIEHLKEKVNKVLLLRPFVLPNDDAIMVLSASMGELVEGPAIMSVAPELLTPRRLIAHTGYVFSRGLPRRADTCVPVTFQRANRTQDFKALPDDALMVRSGGALFNEEMTNSYHDADLGLRISSEGDRNVYCPSARMDTLVEYAGNRQPTDDLASLNAYFQAYGGLKGLDAFNNAGEYYGSGDSYPAVEMWTQNEGTPKAKVAFFICDFELAGHSRGVLPARMLTMHGYDVMISTWATSSIIDWADVCVFQRQYEAVVLERMLEAKAKGKYVIYETDEFFHGLPRNNDAVGMLLEDPRRLRTIEQMIYQSDALVVGSDALAKQYGRFNKSTTVIQTGLDLGLLPKQIFENHTSSIRIAWAGTRTLDKPNLEAVAALKRILAEDNTTKLLIFGIDYRALFHDVPKEQIEFFPSTFDHEDPLGDFHRTLNDARIDIALVPSTESAADCCRGDFDLVQLGAFGIAIIASDVPPYAKFADAAGKGSVLLARSSRDWERYLDRLIESVDERIHMGRLVQSLVWQHCGLDKTGEYFRQVVEEVLSGKGHVPTKAEPTHSLPVSFLNGLTAKKAAEHHSQRQAAYRAMLDGISAKAPEVSDVPVPDADQRAA